MYRLMVVPERMTVVVCPVPDCHPKSRLVGLGMYLGRRVWGMHSYKLFDDIDAAREAATVYLNQLETESKRYYAHGKLVPMRMHDWLPRSDAVVGRRILDRDEQGDDA